MTINRMCEHQNLLSL